MLHDHWCPKIQFQVSKLSLFWTGNVFISFASNSSKVFSYCSHYCYKRHIGQQSNNLTFRHNVIKTLRQVQYHTRAVLMVSSPNFEKKCDIQGIMSLLTFEVSIIVQQFLLLQCFSCFSPFHITTISESGLIGSNGFLNLCNCRI